MKRDEIFDAQDHKGLVYLVRSGILARERLVSRLLPKVAQLNLPILGSVEIWRVIVTEADRSLCVRWLWPEQDSYSRVEEIL